MMVGKVPVDFLLVPDQDFLAAVAVDFRLGPQKAPDDPAQVRVVHDVVHGNFYFLVQIQKKMDNFGFFVGAFLGTIMGSILGPDRPKRGQDEPKRAIRSFKEPKSCIFKNLKKPIDF